jgi:hypothetical protein
MKPEMNMSKGGTAALCVLLLVGCSSPHFVKLDAMGNVDPSVDPKAYQRDLADCQSTATHIRNETGPVVGYTSAKSVLDNCMRGKGYLKT